MKTHVRLYIPLHGAMQALVMLVVVVVSAGTGDTNGNGGNLEPMLVSADQVTMVVLPASSALTLLDSGQKLMY